MPDVRTTASWLAPSCALLVATLLLGGCATAGNLSAAGASGSGGAPAPTSSSALATGGPTPAGSAAVTPSAATSSAARVPPAGLVWTRSPSSAAVQVATTSDGRTSFLWMDPSRLRFRLVPGYAVPEGGPVTAADRTASTWVPKLVAGFDSGYKLSDHVGGYVYRGRTVVPLRAGLASLVVRADGSLTVGAWGRDLTMTPDTVVVRQNLRLLVDHGVAQATSRDGVRTWGIANGSRPLANRSALGLLPDGSLLFEFAHLVTAATLADSLVARGVVTAIDLDMNVSWPTGFVYAHLGSSVVGHRINPFVVRAPSTYLHQFKKDFIAVEAA